MKCFADIYYTCDNDKMRSLDIYLPDNVEGEIPVFVYFHGGGLEVGEKENYSGQAKTVTDKGIGFISANYRMYPNAKYPDFIDDSADAVKWTLENINKYCKCSGVYVGGSSAGGYLSMMLCFDTRYLASRGVDPLAIKGYYHDAGQPTKHYNILKHECGVDPRRIIVDDTAPVYYIGLEEKYPKMHFVVSDNDMKNRYEQTFMMLSTLRVYGFDESTYTHTVKNGKHCQYVGRFSDDGVSEFGLMVADFILSCEGK